MLFKKALLICFMVLIGCTNTLQNAPPSPTLTVPKSQQIKLDGWEFTVPGAFEAKKDAPSNYVMYWSPSKIMVVTFGSDQLKPEDKDITLIELANSGVLALQKIEPTLVPQNSGFVAKLDGTKAVFIILKNRTIFTVRIWFIENQRAYMVACTGYMAMVKRELPMCLDVIDSFKHSAN